MKKYNKALSIILTSIFVLGSIDAKVVEVSAISAEESNLYTVYSENISYSKNKFLKSDDLAVSILEKNNIMLASLTNEQADELRANGYLVEKDIELEASNEKALNEDENILINQWNLDAINLPVEVDPSIEQVKIALLDSGVEFTEDIDIAGRVCFVTEDQDISPLWDDSTGHGTAMAGLIGANKNQDGITGVTDNSLIYSVKVLDENDKTTASKVAAGIYWAIENDMDIINMSFGTSIDSVVLHKAVQDAYNAGLLIIAAGGNDDTQEVQFPAAYPEVLAVGSSDSMGKLVEDTSKGGELELVAPGKSIVSSGLLDGVVWLCGTSAATAQVTGAASILWGMDKSKSADFIKALLISSSKTLKNTYMDNAGLIDIAFAISSYHEFETIYNNNPDQKIRMNDLEAEEFNGVEISPLWTPDDHENIITGYINPRVTNLTKTNLDIMVKTARGADNASYKEHSTLHGTGNYLLGLRYLSKLAQNVKNGMSNINASNAAYSGIPNQDMTSAVKRVSELMLSNGGSSNNERYYRVLGFALHSIGDTFAHRAYVYELIGFIQSDFSNYNNFKAEVNKGTLEYRNVKNFTDAALSKYEDNPNIGENRFKIAKAKSLDLYNDITNGTEYTTRYFTNFNYNLTLDYEQNQPMNNYFTVYNNAFN